MMCMVMCLQSVCERDVYHEEFDDGGVVCAGASD